MSIFQTLGGVRAIINQRKTIKKLEAENSNLQKQIRDMKKIQVEQSNKLYAKDQVIKEQCSEDVDLYILNQEYENTFKRIKEEILQTNSYNSVINIQNKLKSMLEVVSGKHF